MATMKDVARAAGVSTATVSAVINETAFVSPELRSRVLSAISRLNYTPSQAARTLKSGHSQLIAIAVADLANPFFARVVLAAETAASARGYSLVVLNSDENVELERRNLERVRMLACAGLLLVSVGAPSSYHRRQLGAEGAPTVLFGRSIESDAYDTIELDNRAAGSEATSYLLDLGHTRIGSITGPLHLTTAAERLAGMNAALAARGLSAAPAHVRSGGFREEAAYGAATELLRRPDRPTALYVANGVMAAGVMRAIADLGLDCPRDVSVASTDTIPGVGGLRPRLTRTEHPVAEMIGEAFRLLFDRINDPTGSPPEGRRAVFRPSLIVGDSCSRHFETAEA